MAFRLNRYRVVGLASAGVFAVSGLVAGFSIIKHFHDQSDLLQRLVMVSWGDGAHGEALYGAYVYYEPAAYGRLAVKLSVQIGRGDAWGGYQHDERLLGMVADVNEAVALWGAVAWTEDGLVVGVPGKARHVFPRAELERHR